MREITIETIEDYSAKNKLIYLQTSAATGKNVNEAFNMLIKCTCTYYLEIFQK